MTDFMKVMGGGGGFIHNTIADGPQVTIATHLSVPGNEMVAIEKFQLSG